MGLVPHRTSLFHRVHERRDSLRGDSYGIAIHNNMARISSTFRPLYGVLAGGMREFPRCKAQ
jgi:hypothetical protein